MAQPPARPTKQQAQHAANRGGARDAPKKSCHNASQPAVPQAPALPNNKHNMSQVAAARDAQKKRCHNKTKANAAQAPAPPDNKRNMSQVAVAHTMP